MKTAWIRKMYLLAVLVLALSVFSGSAIVQAAEQAPAHKDDMGAMARKLNDPTSDIWALQLELDYIINKGDLSNHSTKNQYQALLQPVMPIPLTKGFKIITRPVIPIVSTSIPRLDIGSFNYHRQPGLGTRDTAAISLDWYRQAGLGDIELPLMLSSTKKSHYMFAVGPTFSFPTATQSSLGSGLLEIGPALVLGYKKGNFSAVTLTQYFWDVAGWGDSNSVSKGSMLYGVYYNIPGPGHWQVGTNPSISYNDKSKSGSKWTVPIGITVGKMVKFGKLPVKIQVGADYSLAYQDDYGERWKFKLQITPVIPSLIKKALFSRK
jgi:hypothetical protein